MGIKTCKTGKTSIFIVNKRLKEDKVKFLIGHDKKKYKQCIITLYIEETLNANISDTSNQLKQILVYNCFYILGEAIIMHNYYALCISQFQARPSPGQNPRAIFYGRTPHPWAKKEFKTPTLGL